MTQARHCKTRSKPGKTPALRLRCPLVVLFALTFLLALDGTGILRISLLCAVLHECGHLIAYYVLVRRAPVVEISPTGLCLRMRGVLLPPVQELWLAAAGPLANLICCCAVLLVMQLFDRVSYTAYWFASANLLIGAGNLLPLPGLDGGYILQSICAMVRGLQFRRR